MTDDFAGDSAWQPVKIGAGGYLTGIDIEPDGTMVVRTDTYGAYIWNGTGWEQLVTADSMPDGSARTGGAYEIQIAPSDTSTFYMALNGYVYKSLDRGQSWTQTGFSPVSMVNLDDRMDGQKMAIDPNDANTVFVGTQQNGLFVTHDGGATWQHVTGVPQGADAATRSDPGLTGIVFDPSSRLANGDTSIVYAATVGSGIFRSTDGGSTWSALSGGPKDASYSVVSSDGSLYVAGHTDGALWKYSHGTWTKLIDNSVHAVAVDPFDPQHIVAITPGGTIQESKDGGSTWTGWAWYSGLESSGDIPWLENTGNYMGIGGLQFDPAVPGRLWVSDGVGVWSTDLPSNLVWTNFITWTSHSAGIEQLVTSDIIAPAGGNPIFASWDRPFFEVTDLNAYPTNYSGGGGSGGTSGSGFSAGWSLDYASSNSKFIVGISDWWGVENSGFSTDGGHTWQKFAGLPSFAMSSVGGSIAASSSTNFIWAPAGGAAPAYTLDGGVTWKTISIPGKTDWSQFDHAYYLDRTTVTADRVQANTFYLYDVATGVYRTTDGGVNWALVHTGPISDWSYWNAKIEAMPGKAGELFFTSGPIDGPNQTVSYTSLMHSTDGGATWQAIADVGVRTFGYGAPATADGPATIFIAGTVGGQYGIWYSTDDAHSWTQIGQYPMGSLDQVNTISGDMDQFGMVYVGFGGSGYAYLDFTHSGDPSTSIPVTGTITGALDNVGAAATVGSGAVINDATPTLSGTLSAQLAAGQLLVVYRDGQRLMTLSPTSSSWSFTDPGANDGTHQYTVRVEDGAGHVGSYSASFGLTIDTVAPDELVQITGANTGASGTTALSFGATTASTLISGTISSSLHTGEVLVVFRDGVSVGTGTVSNGVWTFADNVGPGSYNYTAQVQDAAGNLGHMSNPYLTSGGMNVLTGTIRSDVIVGTDGSDRLSGVPDTGSKIGKGTIDVLTGAGGADLFVLGDSRGRFYDDGSSRNPGKSDYARITDFSAGDKLQLKGAVGDYLQGTTSVNGFSGTGVYYDTNHNHVLDKYDELIALVQNHGPLDPSDMLFV
jgi:hypothetical protein